MQRTDIPQDHVHALEQLAQMMRADKLPLRDGAFDMSTPFGVYGGCGTYACIGGWMGYLLGMSRVHTVQFVSSALDINPYYKPLFYPSEHMNCSDMQKGAQAIENFLQGDNDPWASIPV